MPALAAVGGAKQGGVFHPGVHRVRIGQRWLKMPHPFELPGALGAVVPLVGGEGLAGLVRGAVDELVADAARRIVWLGYLLPAGHLPRLAAVIRALNDLPEPAGGLGHI